MTASVPVQHDHPVLHHSGLTCANLDTAMEFYSGLLGMQVLYQGSGPARGAGIPHAKVKVAFLAAGAARIVELLEYVSPRPVATKARPVNEPGAVHVALLVSDLGDILRRLGQAGFQPLTDPLPTPISTVGLANGGRFVYVLDPDGHVVELIEPR